jgi:glycosyltransferase involved in cell wall biosynthesis
VTRLLLTADRVGGVWAYACELARGLEALGIDVTIAAVGPAPGQAGADQGVPVVETGLPLDWLAPDAASVLAAGERLAALARETGADVVQLNSPAYGAAARFPCPVVAVEHGALATWWLGVEGDAPLPPALAWQARLTGTGLARADAAVAPSAAHAALVQAAYRLAEAPVAILNGRSPAPPIGAEPNDAVLTVGRLWDRAKRTALLDAVAARLPVPFEAVGATTGPAGEAVMPVHLHTPGTLTPDALAARYAARPVFVSAAVFEPFGLAVLEAAQAGCPLVLAANATFRELWTGAALLVDGDDPADWAAAIERVRADAGLRRHLSEAATLRAGRYTAAATAEAMAALYARLLGGAERVAA